MSLPSAINVNLPRIEVDIDGIEGEFELAMGIWTDNTYTTPITGEAEFTVPDLINVGLLLEGSPPANFHLQLKKCWATPRYDC